MDDGIWLITGGAYVGQELAAEFGLLPPTMLPVGTSRLYECQLARIGRNSRVFMTLPETYNLRSGDAHRLAELAVTILPTPDGLQLGEAIVYALNLIGSLYGPVRILHGDTLIDDLPLDGSDEIGVSDEADGYSWAEVVLNKDNSISGLHTVPAGGSRDPRGCFACGYFAIASGVGLVRAITRARGDFIDGLNGYGAERRMSVRRVSSWFDFGHVQTYFRSRRIATTQRSFNALRVDDKTARKTGADGAKIAAEAVWFATVPPQVQVFCARVIETGLDETARPFYTTEYEYLPTLSELFVFGTVGRSVWDRILRSCQDFLEACAMHHGKGSGDAALRALAVAKTKSRLKLFADDTGFPIDTPMVYNGRPTPSLIRIADDLSSWITRGDTNRPDVIMHGDFCFSNTLYNARTQRIRVIDPRGFLEAGCSTVFGDTRYDLAKLAHSIVGRYDQIIAGRYDMPASNDGYRFSIEFESAPHHDWLEFALSELEVAGVRATREDVRAVTAGLFLSMLPLHADRPDRQRAFIANALRLYCALDDSVVGTSA